MNELLVVQLEGEEAMVSWGKRLGRALRQGGTVFLRGELGAGKTTLCRGVLRSLGYTGAVKSPTYTLVEPYTCAGKVLYHFDLYRLGDPEELDYIGIRDYFEDDNICLVEWPERGQGLLPVDDLEVAISRLGAGRSLEARSHTERGRQILAALDENDDVQVH